MVTTYARIALLCLISLAAWGQRTVPRSSLPYATSTLTGGVRLYNGLDQTGSGYALDANAGKLLKALVDANTSVLASLTTNVSSTTDTQNTSMTALYIAPNQDGQRLFFGKLGRGFYAVNWSGVQGWESVPAFRFAVGGLQLGIDTDGSITRLGNRMTFNASSNGVGSDQGFEWYGSSTGYTGIAGGAPLLAKLTTGGNFGIGTGTPTAKLHVVGNATVTGTLAVTGLTVNGAAITNTNSGDQTLSLNGQQLTISGTNGNTVTLPASGGSYVLQSASPYVPVVTGTNSSTITDLLSSVFGQLVTARDQASIQAIINALPTSTTANGIAVPRLIFYGTYDFSANANSPLTVSKSVEMIGMANTVFNGGTTNGFLTLFNNIAVRLVVENITFRSNSTTSSYALTYFNEQGDCKNVTFRRCRWHAPKGNYNAIGLNTWNGTSGSFMENVLFDECVVDSVGRMGGEGLAQKNDGVIRIKNLTLNNCRFDNVGLYNPPNVTKASAQINGMALSISGDIQGVQINNFIARNALVGIELVSAKDVNIVNPTITGARSSTYSDAGVLPATGISITDGGSTDRGVLGRSATNITITGGSINMAGKGIGTYYADRVTITGTKFLAGAYMEIQHATRLNFNSFDYEMTGKNFIASFEDVKNSQIRNVRFSRENNTVTPIYQPINIDGNTANNQFANISIVTNTTVNSGNPDNYYNDQQPYRLRYINEAGTNNSIKDIFLNGQKQPDQVYEAIPTLAITAAGSFTAMTHIARINVNPTTTISSLTVVLPISSVDVKVVEVNFGDKINSGTVVTTLNIQGPGGTTPVQSNTPTSASAGQVFVYKYDSTISRYRRIN